MGYPTALPLKQAIACEAPADPAVGTNITFLRAAFGDMAIVSIEVQLTTDGNVANRYAVMYHDHPSYGLYNYQACFRAMTASDTWLIHAAVGFQYHASTDLYPHRFIPLPNNYYLPYFCFLHINIVNMQAGDQLHDLCVYFHSVANPM